MPWNLYSPFLAWVSGNFLSKKKANIWQSDPRDCTQTCALSLPIHKSICTTLLFWKTESIEIIKFCIEKESGKVGRYLCFKSSYCDPDSDFAFRNVSDPQSELESIGLVKNVFNYTDESLKTWMSAIKSCFLRRIVELPSQKKTLLRIFTPSISFQQGAMDMANL